MWSIPKHALLACQHFLDIKRKSQALFTSNIAVMGLLKKISKSLIINEVIRGTIVDKKPGEIHWRVLLLDPFSSKIVSSCCGMRDITGEGVTLVEDLLKRREPLPFLEAIYILKPTDQNSINALFQDLQADSPPYKAFHIFFIEACPMNVFEKFSEVKHISRIKTLREINMSFIPYESHVFLLENDTNLTRLYYNQSENSNKITASIETMAGQIATLCACLDENPSIIYRSACAKNEQLAASLEKKLQEYKQIEPKLGEGPGKSRSQLIILDRGFDCTSPVLHELTFEAMIHDLLPIENGAYKFKTTTGEQKTVFLDDDEQTWHNLKHLHIADVSNKVPEEYKKFMESKNVDVKGEQISAKDLQLMVKKMPQFQKEMTMFASQMSMAADCLKVYNRIKELCAVEQDVANGTDAEGEKLKPNDFMNKMNPILLDVDKEGGFTDMEKVRLIILYIISKNGITDESLTKLFVHANINPQLRQIITNLALLGPNVVVTGGVKKELYNLERKNREEGEKRYTTSRWTPILKDIIEFTMEDRLDKKNFPYQYKRNDTGDKAPMSTRYGQWYPKGGSQARVLPRLIVFVVGGISLSEIRSIYEINKAQSEWEVVIGSTEVLTPDRFLQNLDKLVSTSVNA